MIDKGVQLIDKCDKGFIWNPSNCEYECDKLCDVGEYLDYKNCKCRKKIIDKLVEECTENSCILYIVLFSIFFTINVGIGTHFVYYKYMNCEVENVSKYDYVCQKKSY